MSEVPGYLTSPPPAVPDTLVSFPRPHVLLVTLNRPKQLNAVAPAQHHALERLWGWYDGQKPLRCAVLTGSGRAFCAGADLKDWNAANASSVPSSSPPTSSSLSDLGIPRGGFGGMSNRGGLKPVVAAVNGICFGGGMEMAVNCDLVVASAAATFGLPEVTFGVVAVAGALPRLVRSVGRQRAAEMALAGRKTYTAEVMKSWGLVNEVVVDGAKVLDKALDWAETIARNSPDAVIVSREGLKLGWEALGPETGTEMLVRGWYDKLDKGENQMEGVKSFIEKRPPRWVDSKL